MRQIATPALALALLAGCSAEKTDSASPDPTGAAPTEACDPAADSDADGLDDCAEVEEHGTDPLSEDSDGDGFTDGAEVDCVSDPVDGEEACYACGWAHNDPGDLVSSGSAVGDTIANLEMLDQCGELVDLWDFAGEYHLLFMTGAG